MNVLHLLRFGLVLDNFDFVLGHFKAIRRKDVAQIFNRFGMKLTLVRASKKTVFAEPPKYFLDLISVHSEVIRVNENIVKIDNNAHIE